MTAGVLEWSVGLTILFVRSLPEDGSPVPKDVGVILMMNCVL